MYKYVQMCTTVSIKGCDSNVELFVSQVLKFAINDTTTLH